MPDYLVVLGRPTSPTPAAVSLALVDAVNEREAIESVASHQVAAGNGTAALDFAYHAIELPVRRWVSLEMTS